MVKVTDERALWLSRHVLPHEPALRNWLKSRRVQDLDIDDIVQETYARLVSLETVETIRDPKNYTFQIAYSIVVSHVRRSRIVSIKSAADLDQFGAEAPDGSPESQMEARDELRELATALAELPDRCREVFLLRRVDGLSQREVSEKLGISESTIEKYMTRGIRHLMDVFGRGGKPQVQASNQSEQKTLSSHDRKIFEPRD